MAAARLTALEKMERRVRRLWVLLIPLVVVAAIDLVTGEPIRDRRVDLAALTGAALQAWGHVAVTRVLRRKRSGIAEQRPSRVAYARGAASSVLSLAVSSGVGYVLFGWVGAVAILVATLVAGGLSVAAAFWIRARRRPPTRGGTPAARP
jgi:hypothetical protein